MPRDTRPLNLTGQEFGRLRVLRLAEPRRTAGGKTRRRWVCLCDPRLGGCGQETLVTTEALRRGDLPSGTRSCGCLMVETSTEIGHAKGHAWTPEQDALLGTMPDQKAADMLGMTQTPVLMRRRSLGIPPFRAPRRKRKDAP